MIKFKEVSIKMLIAFWNVFTSVKSEHLAYLNDVSMLKYDLPLAGLSVRKVGSEYRVD